VTKIKTLGATVLLLAAAAAPVFAQDGAVLGSRYRWEPSSSAYREKPVMNNSEMTPPGDAAVTETSRAWNPTGQTDPGTSNSPGPNSGGE
jgi:hypothetical protein